jgi:hypothetical protein
VLRVEGYRLDPGMRLNALDSVNFFLADVPWRAHGHERVPVQALP